MSTNFIVPAILFIKKDSEIIPFELSSESLSGLPRSLTKLAITGFKAMTSIEPNTFQHLPGLEWLSLEDNSIEHIEPATFNNVKKLTRLVLSRNKLTDFRFDEPPANAEPCCLKFLDLFRNKLVFIAKRTVTNLPKSLVYLDLSQNMIVDIESGAFEDLVNLRSLLLGFNCFEQLDFNNILNSDTANLRFLDVRWCENVTINLQQNEDGIHAKKKRKQSREQCSKSLHNRLVVYLSDEDASPFLEGVEELASRGFSQVYCG
jgi:Leucine-rich repeat (LRR) protein